MTIKSLPHLPEIRASEENDVPSSSPQRASFLRGLEIFVAVARTGGMSSAARDLGMGQPSVSQRIQALEETLGVELLHRRQTGIELTSAGKTVLIYAERLIQLCDEMMNELDAYSQLKRGTLRIAASSTPGNYLMPAMLQRFNEKYDGLRVVLDISDSEKVINSVREGAVEIGILGVGALGSDLECEPFIEDEVVAVAPKGHPILAEAQVPPEELLNHKWIVREQGSGTRGVIEKLLGQGTFKGVDIALEVSSTEAIKLAVRANMGIALISRRAVENEVALGLLDFRSIKGQALTRHFFVLRHRSRTLSPPAQALWEQLLWRGRGRASSGE